MRSGLQMSMQAWRRVSVLLAIIVLCAGCSQKIIDRVVIQRDTTTVHHRDTTYRRDSIYIREYMKGDTVYVDRYRDRYVFRDRWRDSVTVKVDSVAVERIKEVKVEKPLSWSQKVRIGAFWWLLAGGVAYTLGAVLYGAGKKRRWFHGVFHIFVLLGSILQAVCILRYAL